MLGGWLLDAITALLICKFSVVIFCIVNLMLIVYALVYYRLVYNI